MITSIQGLLAAATPLHAVIEVNGFGYEVNIPVTTAERLPAPGTTVKLHTIVIYREDAQTLYGFASAGERDFFRLMIENVTGVGPKLALTIMSRLALPALESAIRLGDVASLARCPGIGKKTAERLVVELKSKLGGVEGTGAMTSGESSSSQGHSRRDAVAALVALGYKLADAEHAVGRAATSVGASASTEQLVKTALGG